VIKPDIIISSIFPSRKFLMIEFYQIYFKDIKGYSRHLILKLQMLIL